MQRRHLEVVIRVMRVGYAPRQFAGVMVEDIRERCDALANCAVIKPRAFETKARNIPQRLRTVFVAIVLNEGGEFAGKFVGHADRDALHARAFRRSADRRRRVKSMTIWPVFHTLRRQTRGGVARKAPASLGSEGALFG
jgi:hypothetical protein